MRGIYVPLGCRSLTLEGISLIWEGGCLKGFKGGIDRAVGTWKEMSDEMAEAGTVTFTRQFNSYLLPHGGKWN